MSNTSLQTPGMGIESFFNARGIAIVGASNDINKIGGRPVHLLSKYGYDGAIYPVNPGRSQVQGLPAYPSLKELPGVPELAVLAVSSEHTLAALEECAAVGVRAVVVLSAGFAEKDDAGAALQERLTTLARENGIRLLGPNCLGVVNVVDRVIGSFTIVLEENMPLPGNVGIVSQSGNVGSFLMQNVSRRGLGVSRFMATGNEADVDVADGIAALAQDDVTQIILCCMETCRDAGRLTEALDMARRQGKPVIVLKIGSTDVGQAAAASHTGALAGSDSVIDAVFRRHGVVRVHSIEALLDMGQSASLLGTARLPKGPRVTLVAASGGFGIMMADAATKAGLALPALSETTRARIQEAVPMAGTHNPVDASAQMSSDPAILFKMLSALLEEPNTDATLLFLSLSLYNRRLRGIYMDALKQIREAHPDKLLMVVSEGPSDAVAEVNALGIPVFGTIDAAASGIDGLVRLSRVAELSAPPVYDGPIEPVDPAVFRNEAEAKKALSQLGIPVLEEKIATSCEQAVELARGMGLPVVLKIISPDITHKTEAGGVALDLASEQAVRDAYAQMLESARAYAPSAQIDGVLVTPMAKPGMELIMGVSKDPVFGPVVMVGTGGVFAEILQDVAVQVAPVSFDEARSMIRSLKLYPILDGARGKPKADVDAVAQALVVLSEFACRHEETVAEIDINPVLVYPQGAGIIALDTLMVPAQSQR
ncbi:MULTISPECIES: acetate--CoA ligase family protein [unclassified Halomonas]|uniref:acetate--CoA ligase family protein n=1 Tax=unclassified Halomonas TaxID=2609666 RepID=UPI0020768550|nr:MULTISPECIES: acetate--CoA ligase family protein [unclassified Halomonas]